MKTLFVENQAGKIAYEVSGEGPLVVCAPGMGDVRQQFRFLAPALVQAGYRVATMDIRGHGESSTQWSDFSVVGMGSDILALIREFGDRPAFIVGHSISAASALWAAVEAPELVRGLVLIGAGVRGSFSRLQKALYGALFLGPWGPGLWKRFYGTLYPMRKPDDYADYARHLHANLGEAGRIEALRAMVMALEPTPEERLMRVQSPALVVVGSKDADFKDPAAEAEWLAGKIHGRTCIVDGTGHYPHVEMPQVTNPAIVAFINGVRV